MYNIKLGNIVGAVPAHKLLKGSDVLSSTLAQVNYPHTAFVYKSSYLFSYHLQILELFTGEQDNLDKAASM